MTDQPNNAFVKNLLKCSVEQLNANAKWDEPNPDTELFHDAIYVPTKLDDQLLPILLTFKYPLVFLAGTPGSGKTQFLKKLAEKLCLNGYEFYPSIDGFASVANYRKESRVIRIKHDATQVEHEIDDAAKKLGEFLQDDWSDPNFDRPEKSSHYVVGINQGVLQSLCDLDGFRSLSNTLINSSDERVLLVDLAKRSAVYPPDYQDAFITYLILQIVEEEHWENSPTGSAPGQTCYGCDLLEEPICPILTNIRWLRNASTWQRIHELFQINHFVAGNVTTFRDALAVISKGICGYFSNYEEAEPCDCIRRQARRGDLTGWLNLTRLLLYNSIFTDQDPYGEYIESLELPPNEKKEHIFHGFSGAYFVSDLSNPGFMALLDPTRSDNDELRTLDDDIFNSPADILNNPKVPLEKKLFDEISRKLESLETDETDSNKSWRAREWLLYCLIRLSRRRQTLLANTPASNYSQYDHASSFFSLILEMVEGPAEGRKRQVAADIRLGLAAIAGNYEGGTMKVPYRNRDAKISARLVLQLRFTVKLPDFENTYVECYPRELLFFALDPTDSSTRLSLAPLRVDLEVWECLKRAAEGFRPSYLGMERIRGVEGFLEGLMSLAWNLPNSKLEIASDEETLEIVKEGREMLLR